MTRRKKRGGGGGGEKEGVNRINFGYKERKGESGRERE